MAIDSKLGILLMFACTAWSSYYHLSLFVLVTITLSKGQDLIATPPEDKSCNGEYCSWDDEARKKDELVRTKMTVLELRRRCSVLTIITIHSISLRIAIVFSYFSVNRMEEERSLGMRYISSGVKP